MLDYNAEGISAMTLAASPGKTGTAAAPSCFRTEEDENSDNEISIMEHSITVGGREVSGPSVRVGIRDND